MCFEEKKSKEAQQKKRGRREAAQQKKKELSKELWSREEDSAGERVGANICF